MKPKRKYQLALLAIFMVLTSFIEAISISSALPFLAALTSPEDVKKIKLLQPVLNHFEINDIFDIRLTFTLLFIGLILLSGAFRVLFFLFQTHYSNYIGIDLSTKAYERTIGQTYTHIISRNSSEILSGLQKAKDLVGYIVQPTLTFISSIFMLIVVFITIFIIEPKVAIFGLLGFGSLYMIARILSKNQLKRNSKIYALESSRVNQIIQESLGGIRDLIIDATQLIYVNLYRTSLTRMQSAGAGNVVLGQIPKFLIETFSIVLLAATSLVFIKRDEDFVSIIPLLGVIALGAQRLLPLLQQTYAAYVSIKGGLESTLDALGLLDQNLLDISNSEQRNKVAFNKSIKLKNVCFAYGSEQRFILDKVSLEVPLKSRVGIIGASGSGKSTLVDLIMGLLIPNAGAILVDDQELTKENIRNWHSCISHVPQSIFLADTTIGENIAFGVDQTQIDWDRVRAAAEIAQLSNFIEHLPEGYLTAVGERGIRISGGQRQRIGLARAFYKKTKLLILDEATNALDSASENRIIDAINSLEWGVTVFSISHRLSSLQYCDLIIEIKNGTIAWSGTYAELGKRSTL